MTAPDLTPPRIATLDTLRGVAVLGILAMNAVSYAMPAQAYSNPAAYGGAQGIDLVSWTLSFIFVDGKMRGLFSLLFGASLLLVTDAAEAQGRSPAATHYSRILWLGLFGAIHYYLIWRGDILLHYALVGLIAYLFRGLGLKALSMAALIATGLAVFNAMSLSAAGLEYGADPKQADLWRAILSDLRPLSPRELAADLAIHRGSWLDLVRHRFAEDAWLPFEYLKIGAFETLAFMLAGMFGLRSGFLTGAWEARLYRAIAFWCVLAGATGYAVLAVIQIRSGFEPLTLFIVQWGGTVLFRFVMVAGYAALIILLARESGSLTDRLAAAGRMAFSNYLGGSILMAFFFYGWGLGLYGKVGRVELWLPVIGIWALTLIWSKPWLDRYRYGPLEWLWRSLSRGRLQPMRKPAAV